MGVWENPPVSLREVAQALGVTRQTVRAWVKKGLFPQPLKFGDRKLFWPATDLEQVLIRRDAARRTT
jgi:predicted DNA-binding transcriptional regulator AlpA